MKYQVRNWISVDDESHKWFIAHGRQRVPKDTSDGGDEIVAAFADRDHAEQFAYLANWNACKNLDFAGKHFNGAHCCYFQVWCEDGRWYA